MVCILLQDFNKLGILEQKTDAIARTSLDLAQ
jgi:hypothetical protein